MHTSLQSGFKVISLDYYSDQPYFYNVNTKSEIVCPHGSEDYSLLGADNMEFGRQAYKELERTCCLLLQLFNPKVGDSR